MATATTFILPSCQKDEISNIKGYDKNEDSITTESNDDFTVIFKQRKKLTKGLDIDFITDETIEQGVAYFSENPNKTYQTMKVIRRSDPSKYFYVMITNLDIPYPFDLYLTDSTQVITSECSPYADNMSYLQKYGLLYTKYGADHICEYLYMRLPVIRNGKEVNNRKRNIRGRLMTRQDIADILEVDIAVADSCIEIDEASIDEYYDETKHAYYNAFVFGLELKSAITDAHHSLGGYRDKYNVDDPNEIEEIRKQWPLPDYALKQMYTKDYANITHIGVYWMANENWHRHKLSIIKDMWMAVEYKWLSNYHYAGNPNSDNKDYGYSVRLVFDPFKN